MKAVFGADTPDAVTHKGDRDTSERTQQRRGSGSRNRRPNRSSTGSGTRSQGSSARGNSSSNGDGRKTKQSRGGSTRGEGGSRSRGQRKSSGEGGSSSGGGNRGGRRGAKDSNREPRSDNKSGAADKVEREPVEANGNVATPTPPSAPARAMDVDHEAPTEVNFAAPKTAPAPGGWQPAAGGTAVAAAETPAEAPAQKGNAGGSEERANQRELPLDPQ